MAKRKRKNWTKFFEENANETEFTMYRIIRNLPHPKATYTDKALIKLKCDLQKRHNVKIN